MKKVCSLVCLVLLLLAMVMPVSAEEYCEDSVTIPEEVLACLDEETVDDVFCVYRYRDDYTSFAQYGNMDSVLKNVAEPELQRYYFVIHSQNETACYTYDGSCLIETGYTWGAEWFSLHGEKVERVIQKVAADIVVENTYYLWWSGLTAVYYETNFGDFVYVFTEQKEYLMALDPFLSMQEELHDMRMKLYIAFAIPTVGREPITVMRLLTAYADLSPYDITSPDFDPYALFKLNLKPGKFIAIGLLVLLAVLLVGRYLIRGHRKYRAQKDKQRYRF